MMVAFVNIKKKSLAHDPAPVSVKVHFPKFNFISGFCLVEYYLQNYNVLYMADGTTYFLLFLHSL